MVAWQRTAQVDGLVARRSRTLELLDAGKWQFEVAVKTAVGIATVGRARRRYLNHGSSTIALLD